MISTSLSISFTAGLRSYCGQLPTMVKQLKVISCVQLGAIKFDSVSIPKHTSAFYLILLSTKNVYTVKPVFNGHSQKHKKLVFKPNYPLSRSKVLQNAPKGAFCNTFDLH